MATPVSPLSRSKTLEFLTPLLLSHLTSNHSKYSEYDYFLPPLAKILVLATLFSRLNSLLSALISALASYLFLAQQPKYFLKTSVKPHLSFPSQNKSQHLPNGSQDARRLFFPYPCLFPKLSTGSLFLLVIPARVLSQNFALAVPSA